MNEIRYFGFVDEAGKMQIHGRHSFVEDIRLFTGKAIDIIVRVQGRRTNVQNAYYWSGVIPIVQRGMKDMGVVMSREQTHDLLKYKFLGAQCQRIYDWLITGKTLTRKEAEDFLDIGDARARIRDLRNAGIPITDKIAGNGNRKYKVYYIKTEACTPPKN